MNGEQSSTEKKTGYVFKPSLQDISLKRFRMRYSVLSDCYYLHWDDAVCAPLAKIEGLSNGTNVYTGVGRYTDNVTGENYVGKTDVMDKRSEVTWKFDFTDCGLVVRNFKVKGRSNDDNEIDWRVIGDDEVGCRPMLAATDDFIDIPEVNGCRVVTVTAVIYQATDGQETLRVLNEGQETPEAECPLDIKVDLMCPRSQDENYVGEILLGIKWNPVDDEEPQSSEGQLQVYIVEGAGMVDEDTHKPFKAFIKCNLLPEGKKEHTSPRQTAFPNWAKQFHFHHLEREDVVYGGLEVLLCDSHLLYNSTIAGIRLCVPQRNGRKSLEMRSSSYDSPVPRSPVISRSASPPSTPSDPSDEGEFSSPSHHLPGSRNGSPSPTHLAKPASPLPSRKVVDLEETRTPSFERFPYMNSATAPPGPAFRRSLTPTPQSNSYTHGLSPPILRRTHSPMSIAKSFFRLSGGHLRESVSLSPISSPILAGRKKFKGHHRGSTEFSEYVYSWMSGVTRTERSHWQQMLEQDGEWVYCWHTLRPNLKPTHS